MVGEEILQGAGKAISLYVKIRTVLEIIFGVVLVVVGVVLAFFKIYALALVVFIIGVLIILSAKFYNKRRVYDTKYGRFVVRDSSQTTIEGEQKRFGSQLPFPYPPAGSAVKPQPRKIF